MRKRTLAPALRAALYWGYTAAFVALACIVAYFESGGGRYPDWVDTVAGLLLAVGVIFEITAATNIRGTAIDPSAFGPRARKVAYVVAAVLKLLTLVLPALLGIIDPTVVDKSVLAGVTAVLLTLGGMLSLVASSHVPTSPQRTDPVIKEIA